MKEFFLIEEQIYCTGFWEGWHRRSESKEGGKKKRHEKAEIETSSEVKRKLAQW